jgi:hypothetical protein
MASLLSSFDKPAEELLRELLALDGGSFLFKAGQNCAALYSWPVAAKIALLGVLNRRSVTASGEPTGVFATGDLLVIIDLFLHTKGSDLTALKLGLESCLSKPQDFIHHDLLNLFNAILKTPGGPAKGEALLKHFRGEGVRALQQWHQERLAAAAEAQQTSAGVPSLQPWWPVKVYSDVDDTMLPKLLDHSFPGGSACPYYPGVAAFLYAMQGLDPLSVGAALSSSATKTTQAPPTVSASSETTGQEGEKKSGDDQSSPGSSDNASPEDKGGSSAARKPTALFEGKDEEDTDSLAPLKQHSSKRFSELKRELTIGETKVRRRKRDAVRSFITRWVPGFGSSSSSSTSASTEPAKTVASASLPIASAKKEEEPTTSQEASAVAIGVEENNGAVVGANANANAAVVRPSVSFAVKVRSVEQDEEDIDVAGFSSAEEGPNDGDDNDDDSDVDDNDDGSSSANDEAEELAFITKSVKASSSAELTSLVIDSPSMATAASNPTHHHHDAPLPPSPLVTSTSASAASAGPPPSPLRKSSLLTMPNSVDNTPTPLALQTPKEKSNHGSTIADVLHDHDHGNFFSPAPAFPVNASPSASASGAVSVEGGLLHDVKDGEQKKEGAEEDYFLFFDCPSIGHRGLSGLTYLSARPPILKGKTLRLLTELLGEDHLPQAILCGSLMNLASHSGMAVKKVSNYRIHRKLFPEFRVVWLGDSGQGDIQAGLEMLAMHEEEVKEAEAAASVATGDDEGKAVGGAGAVPTPPAISWYPSPKPLVLIHDICNAEQIALNADPSKRQEYLAKSIHLFDSYIDAACICFGHGLMPLSAFHGVIDAVTTSLPEVTFNTVAQRDGRLADYHRAMKRAREATDRYHRRLLEAGKKEGKKAASTSRSSSRSGSPALGMTASAGGAGGSRSGSPVAPVATASK